MQLVLYCESREEQDARLVTARLAAPPMLCYSHAGTATRAGAPHLPMGTGIRADSNRMQLTPRLREDTALLRRTGAPQTG